MSEEGVGAPHGERLAKVETQVAALVGDMSEVKTDVKEVKGDVKSILLAQSAATAARQVIPSVVTRYLIPLGALGLSLYAIIGGK